MSLLNPANPYRKSTGAGEDGKSAYELALDKGFVGTEEEWLESLIGPVGPDGLSAFQIAQQNGFTGSEQEWLESLVGPEGRVGEQGERGISAYEVAVENGFEGTEEEWLTSLVGPEGKQGEEGSIGPIGPEGLSAYQVAQQNGFTGSEQEWLESLIGPEGQQGVPGDQGPQGIPGGDGPQGIQGERGEPFSIAKIYSSVNEMENDFGNQDVKVGQFVLIDTGDVEDEDNAKLFIKTLIGFSFVTDMSGAQGLRGPQGIQGIQGIPGTPGANGFTPTIAVEKIDGGNRITVTNQSGTTTFDVKDGADGTSDLQTIKDTAVQNRSAFNGFTLPSCIHFVNSSLAYSFPNDILYISLSETHLSATTIGNVTLTFEIDQTTGDLALVKEETGVGSAIASFDDTMSENENGSYGVANPMRGILTQAEYDALPEDEKNKGTYVISDGNGSGGSVSGGCNTGEVYSEEETRIGTWIDGRPLYRKVYQTTTAASAPGSTSINVVDLDIDTAVKLSGMIIAIGNNGKLYGMPVPYNDNTYCVFMSINLTDKIISLQHSHSSYNNRPATIWIEYTKSTDEPSI